ncbi:MAG: LacI family DNA-binding transcriptional regulator [Sphingomicrobium sp.]
MSRALSGSPSVSAETRARVLAAAKNLHYIVDKNASGLRRQQSRTIAQCSSRIQPRRHTDQSILSVHPRRADPRLRALLTSSWYCRNCSWRR